MSQTKAQLVVGLNVNASAPASALQIDASGNINLDSNTLYVDAANNRVGIGTNSPSEELHVVGDILVTGYNRIPNANEGGFFDVSGNNGITIKGSTNASPHITTFYNSGGASVTIDASRRVGIGTTNPGSYNAQLAISGGRLAVVYTASGIELDPQFGFVAGTVRAYDRITTSYKTLGLTGDAVAFGINDVEKARIDSSGRLLVGTSSSTAEAKFIVQGGTTGSGGGMNIQRSLTTASAGSTIGFINFTNSANDVGASIAANGDGTWSAGTSHPTNLTFSTTAAGASSPSERMRITNAGNVGIGTTSPGANLEIKAASTPVVRLNQADTYYAPIKLAGNDLEIRGSSGTIEFYNGANDGDSSTEKMRIDGSGRLLVGTSSVYADSTELFESYKSAGTNRSWTSSSSLGNDEEASWGAIGGVSGASLRQIKVGVYKHSGIATPCAFMLMQAQNADSYYYWTDNTSMFRISTLTSNIGTTGGTVVGTQTSDERIKNILGPVEYGLETIKQINAVRYSLKVDPETEKLGFIAQQVAPLVPEAIYDTKEPIEGEPKDAPTKLGMEYVSLIPVLVNAIKELSAEVDALKAQLQAQ